MKLGIAGIALAFVIAGAAGTRPAAASEATYVGSAACEQCHEDQWKDFQHNVHHRAEMDSTVLGAHTGCEGCHGPGSLHVEAAGDTTNPGFASIRIFSRMKPAEISAACMNCHKDGEQFFWEQSRHAHQNVTCTNCHSVHHAKSPLDQRLLAAPTVNELCVKCHTDKQADLAHTAHMPLREGAMTCADCHNPHGSSGPRALRAATVNDLCESCHTDKRGPMLWEHPPVRENCLNCHQPHGSNDNKVLASREPFLCQRCHIATRHPSTLYDLPDLQSNRLFNRSCTNCHSQIHGSNDPSGDKFLR